MRDILIDYFFEDINNPCTLDDFEYVPIYAGPFWDKNFDCYKFNGGRNALNHETEIFSSSKVGYRSGLNINFNLTKNRPLCYFIGDTYVKPIWTELNNIIQRNHENSIYVVIKKSVDIKLPKPYSNCTGNINIETSNLVKEIIQQNITYRMKYCYELCYNNYLIKYAVSKNISKGHASFELKFDFSSNCSHMCPFECSSTTFDVFQNEIEYDNRSFYMNFFYSDLKYTEISQSEKTTQTDLISNTGGVLGLFFELSFISIYRLINFVLELISVLYLI